jgi:TetR/AcrR family transcriptional regulator, repressor of fatR-cypB operon
METTRPRAKRGRPPERPDRRESIMDAALACFVDRGFYGTAMPEIAEKAGIASGTIYHYFENKEALVNALYRAWKTKVVQRVFAAFPASASPRAQFEVVWHEIVAFALAHPTAFAFIELHNHASYLDAESKTIDRTIKDFTASILQRAQGEGLVKPLDPYVLMELVFGSFIAMMRAHWEGRIQLDDEVIRAAERACWDTIAVHP